MKTILSLLAITVSTFAQGVYVVEHKAALSASADAVTMQIPAGVTRSAQMLKASIYSSAQVEVTLERDGTAATTTEIPVYSTTSGSTSSARAYISSNVGAGTVIGRYIVPAGSTVVLDLSDMGFSASANPRNVTIRVASTTATIVAMLKWREF